jgi:hypothetical protein
VRIVAVTAAALVLAPTAAAWPTASLKVTVWPKGKPGVSQRWKLHCDPLPGGTHPSPGRACLALARHPHALKPVSKKVACLQIWSGPQVALVRGTFRGKHIRAWFKRTDGCETGRWNALAALLPLD